MIALELSPVDHIIIFFSTISYADQLENVAKKA